MKTRLAIALMIVVPNLVCLADPAPVAGAGKNAKAVAEYKAKLAYDKLCPADKLKVDNHDGNVTADYIEKLKATYSLFSSEKGVTFINGVNRVGLDFLKTAYKNKTEENRVYSPLAMASNFSVLSNLVKENDLKSILKSYSWDSIQLSDVNTFNRGLLEYSKLYRRGYELNLAAAAWTDAKINFTPATQSKVTDTYGSSFSRFQAGQTESLAQKINAWTKEKTKGKVDNAVSAGDLTDSDYFIANPNIS